MFNLDYIYDWSSHMSLHNFKHFENKDFVLNKIA